MKRFTCWLISFLGLSVLTANSQPVINGSISGSEGWVHLTETPYAAPAGGGSATTSDLVGETSSFNWWDGINNQNMSWDDNRGDVINFYVSHDTDYLYLGLTGPTLPFNSFTDSGNGGNNDMGDIFIAIDMAGGSPSGFLTANQGHPGFGVPGEGVRAIDFNGWRPSHILGLQYVDNGGGGGGFANLFDTTLANDIASAAQGGAGSFAWNAGINAAAAYDTVNNNAGEFEFRIAWSLLGFAETPLFHPMRFAAYTTANFGGSDAFDSGPGTGQTTVHEEIGDFPGDVDQIGSDLYLFAGDAGTIPVGSRPGANYVDPNTYSYDAQPNFFDEIDTIAEYYRYVIVPEPGTASLLLLGIGLLALRSRRS